MCSDRAGRRGRIPDRALPVGMDCHRVRHRSGTEHGSVEYRRRAALGCGPARTGRTDPPGEGPERRRRPDLRDRRRRRRLDHFPAQVVPAGIGTR